MSNQGNGQAQQFDVRMSERIKSRLFQLRLQARAEGRGKRFSAAVRQIIERLQNDPLNLGEPLYRLPALHLAVRQAIVDFVVVDFAVHEDRPLVFVRGFRLLEP